MTNEKLITLEHFKDILPLFENDTLNKIKELLPKNIEPMHDDIPLLFINGEMPTDKTYVPMEMEYVSKTEKFHSYIRAKLQGTSSLDHPKKNLTIVLYEDESRSNVLYKDFKGWGKANKFVLKADYIDILHARNVVCAKLWSKVVASRPDYESLPEALRKSPNNGAIDGFPVKVYLNGYYRGLYSFTIPKSAWQFGLNENNPSHSLLNAEMNDNGDELLATNPCNFSELWDGSEEYWSVEVGQLNDAVVNSFNNIVNAISNNTGLNNYLDIQSAIDYFIFQEIILGVDGLAKNMLLVTYDMTKWYLSAYDMDSTFDLDWDGSLLEGDTTNMPLAPYHNQYSNLLDYIKNYYSDEYLKRYIELRKSVLSYSSIVEEFEKYVGIFGEDVYIKDTDIYYDIPSVTDNTLKWLRSFVKYRLQCLDSDYGVVI